jgi:hypothetical protein
MNRTITHCRACGSLRLTSVFDLGDMHLANDFRGPGEGVAESAPLCVMFCKDCTLAQLSVVVDPEVLYSKYAYRSDEGQTHRTHIDLLFNDLKKRCSMESILEVGSNTGTLLRRFRELGSKEVFGIDPAKNLVEQANDSGIPTICEFFGEASVRRGIVPFPFDLILARHVFCHVDDWQNFICGLELLATDKTVIAIEVPYCGDLLSQCAFDTIYHEHLSYMTVTAMDALLTTSSLKLVSVVRYAIHGQSIVMLLKRKDAPADGNVQTFLGFEKQMNWETRWHDFNEEVQNMIVALRLAIHKAQITGNEICGYGASAKSSVWVNACKFTEADLMFITDTTPEKQGKFIPGTTIPIVGPDRLIEADMAILFAWNYRNEILEKEKTFRDKGGKFIIPVPMLTIV